MAAAVDVPSSEADEVCAWVEEKTGEVLTGNQRAAIVFLVGRTRQEEREKAYEEYSPLRSELLNIARADIRHWSGPLVDRQRAFLAWAQNRAQHTLFTFFGHR